MKKILHLFTILILAASFGFAQNPQTSSDPLVGVNARYSNGVAPGYYPTAGSGLTLNIGQGAAFCASAIEPYAGGTLTLTDNTTSYVYLDTSASCAPASNTTGFSSTTIPIATVVTSSGAITTITDDRTPFTASSSSLPANTLTIANAATTGTTLYTLTKLTGAPSTAVIAATTDTGGIVGIPIAGAGTTGNVTLQLSGSVSCVFDGATTAGDYVQISSTTAGDCHDYGSSYPTSAQAIGRVLSTNAAAGTYTIDLFPAEIKASAGPNFADAEVPSGSAGTSFTLAHTPSPASSLILVWNGLVRKQGVDYTLSGATITTTTTVDPSTDNPLAWYRY